MTLSASLRVKLSKEIMTRLSNEEWPLLDLTLNEFGLPTNSSWSDSKGSYVAKMISSATDKTLIDLAQHVGFDLQEAIDGPKIQPLFRENEMFRVFLTHLAIHRKFTAELQEKCFHSESQVS